MKTTIYSIIGSALIASLAWFCFSCAEKSDAPANTTPEQIAAVNPDLAGKTHNDCLDIFYKKLQALKSSKAQRTRNGGEGEDLPPTPGNDDELTREELEDLIVESLVEGLQNMDVSEEEKEEIITGINEAMTYANENKDSEDCYSIQWSQDAIALQVQLNEILNTEYDNVQDLISAIKSYENNAREILSAKEYNALMVGTSIIRNTLMYWNENCTTWIPQTRSKNDFSWRTFAGADIEGACKALCFTNSGLGSFAVAAVAYALEWSTLGVTAAVVGAYAVSMSICAAAIDTEYKGHEIEIDDQIDFCCTIVENALEEFAGIEDTPTPGID